jgi:hypothetical protein
LKQNYRNHHQTSSIPSEIKEEDECEDYYQFYNYECEDLNKLNTDELNKRKDEMEKLYTKNAILPNSENFVFDVRKEFNVQNCEAEWDDEDECF